MHNVSFSEESIPWRAAVTAIVAALVLSLHGVAAPVTEEEVEQARTEMEAAAERKADALADLDAAVAAYEEANNELEALTFRMARMRDRMGDLEERLRSLRRVVRDRAVETYMSGTVGAEPLGFLFESSSLQEAVLASELAADATAGDVAAIAALEEAKEEMDRLTEQYRVDAARVDELRAVTTAVVARMNELYGEAEDELAVAEDDLETVTEALAEQRRIEEEERLRREEEERLRLEEEERLRLEAEAAAAEGLDLEGAPGFICPVKGQTWFRDTWGAPRSGGRKHKGTDMFAPRGTPLVAVGEGTVRFGVTPLGGNIAWVYTDYGANYFYAHLDRFPKKVKSGDRVKRGQVIGYVGDTGNSDPGAYHLHFGVYPSGTFAVNPYPMVDVACNQ